MTDQFTSMLSLPAHLPEVSARQETDAYRRRLRKLPRKTQQVFLLSRLDNLPYAGIGQLLEIDAEAVERCMVRVLEHCRAPSTGTDDAIRAQALRWYVHLQSPQATASQRIEFRHWLDAEVAHLNAFQDTERLWRRLQAPAGVMGASGWHRRKRRVHVGWLLLTAVLCSMLVTAEAFT